METNIRFVAHLTENHQLQAADKLISKLRQQAAANEEYINELEELVEQLKAEIAKKDERYMKMCQKYSDDVCQFIKTDLLYEKYKAQIDELKEENVRYKRQKEDLICRIAKLQSNV